MHDLTRWRKDNRWTASAFAKRLDVSRDAIHRWERQHAMPAMNRMIEIVRLTNGEVGPESWLPDAERHLLDEHRSTAPGSSYDGEAQEDRPAAQ